MAGTVDSPPGDEGMVKRAGGNPGGLAKQHPGIEILSLAQGEVDFRAVAGGQHHGSPAAQFHHTAVQLRGGGLGKAQLFAQFNGGLNIVQAGHANFHNSGASRLGKDNGASAPSGALVSPPPDTAQGKWARAPAARAWCTNKRRTAGYSPSPRRVQRTG